MIKGSPQGQPVLSTNTGEPEEVYTFSLKSLCTSSRDHLKSSLYLCVTLGNFKVCSPSFVLRARNRKRGGMGSSKSKAGETLKWHAFGTSKPVRDHPEQDSSSSCSPECRSPLTPQTPSSPNLSYLNHMASLSQTPSTPMPSIPSTPIASPYPGDMVAYQKPSMLRDVQRFAFAVRLSQVKLSMDSLTELYNHGLPVLKGLPGFVSLAFNKLSSDKICCVKTDSSNCTSEPDPGAVLVVTSAIYSDRAFVRRGLDSAIAYLKNEHPLIRNLHNCDLISAGLIEVLVSLDT